VYDVVAMSTNGTEEQLFIPRTSRSKIWPGHLQRGAQPHLLCLRRTRVPLRHWLWPDLNCCIEHLAIWWFQLELDFPTMVLCRPFGCFLWWTWWQQRQSQIPQHFYFAEFHDITTMYIVCNQVWHNIARNEMRTHARICFYVMKEGGPPRNAYFKKKYTQHNTHKEKLSSRVFWSNEKQKNPQKPSNNMTCAPRKHDTKSYRENK
jgi:hypothetical protein